MTTPRDHPYVWTTWLTKLLAGEAHCTWAVWFKAHHKDYAKQPSDFDLFAWRSAHTALVNQCASILRVDNWTVAVEDQNAFTLQGRNGILAGKPDIIATSKAFDEILIVDCKTGKRRDSDRWQVMIYMMAKRILPTTEKQAVIHGEIRYPDGAVAISAADITPARQGEFRFFMEEVGHPKAPATTPSFRECRFCDITREDCPSRCETKPERVVVQDAELGW